MIRQTAQTLLRSAASPSRTLPLRTSTLGKRFASTSPANARRSWKSSALRWGIAIGGLYYYNTSPVFAEQPQHNLLNPNLDAVDDEVRDHSTLHALTSGRVRQSASNASVLHAAVDSISSENASTSVGSSHENSVSTGASELEEEAAGEGAFNPETGEINWDCPCLGGMAHGPCGEEFREAFSCFVFSEDEPKGMNCIDKFQNMQGCFQKYPEIYKGELEDDEELSEGLEEERQELVNEIAERKKQQTDSGSQKRLLEESDPAPAAPRAPKKAAKQESQQQPHVKTDGDNEPARPMPTTRKVPQPESLPTAATDATKANLSENNQPAEEGKVKANNESSPDPKSASTRKDVTEDQDSGIASHPKEVSSDPENDSTPKSASKRKDVTADQDSGIAYQPKEVSSESENKSTPPDDDIIPRAAFDGRTSGGK